VQHLRLLVIGAAVLAFPALSSAALACKATVGPLWLVALAGSRVHRRRRDF